MKKLVFIIFLFNSLAKAQLSEKTLILTTDPTGACPNARFAINITANTLWYCSSNSWIVASSGSFSGISGTTNQIVVTGTSPAVISLPATLTLPGTLTSQGTYISSTQTGNVIPGNPMSYGSFYFNHNSSQAAVIGYAGGSNNSPSIYLTATPVDQFASIQYVENGLFRGGLFFDGSNYVTPSMRSGVVLEASGGPINFWFSNVQKASISNTGVLDVNTGFTIGGVAPLNHALIGNGTNYVDSVLPSTSVRLDQVLDPTADKTFAMGGHKLNIDYGTGATSGPSMVFGDQTAVGSYNGLFNFYSTNSFVTSPPYSVDVASSENDAAAGNFGGLRVSALSLHPSGTMNYVTGIYALAQNNGAGIVDNLTGIQITDINNIGHANNIYGLNIDNVSGGDNNYAIKTGLGLNSFGDRVGIGADPGAGVDLDAQSTGVINAKTGFRVNGAAPSGHVLLGDGTNYVDGTISSSGNISVTSMSNDGTNATTLHKLAKSQYFGGLRTILTTDTILNSPIVGICDANCGTSGFPTIITHGPAICTFDGSTTAGHFVVPSTTVAGDCHDSGASGPEATGKLQSYIGTISTTNSGVGNYLFDYGNISYDGSDSRLGVPAFTQGGTFPIFSNLLIDSTSANSAVDIIGTGGLNVTAGALNLGASTANRCARFDASKNLVAASGDCAAGGGGGISGLTTNTIPLAASSTTLADSPLTYNSGSYFSVNSKNLVLNLPASGTVDSPILQFTNSVGGSNNNWQVKMGSGVGCTGMLGTQEQDELCWTHSGGTNGYLGFGYGDGSGQIDFYGGEYIRSTVTTGGFVFSNGATNVHAQFNAASGSGWDFNRITAAPVFNATTGFEIGGAATTGNYLRGNGTNFVSSAIQAADIPAVTTLNTATDCTSSASPATCGSSSSGSFVIAASGTSVVVNTTAVTANSKIFLQEDTSLGTKLGVTCNTGILANPAAVTARTAATSFTVSISVGLAVNPVCMSYFIIGP